MASRESEWHAAREEALHCRNCPPVPIAKNRGRIVDLNDQTKAMVTIHPSYLLHMEEADKEREFARFVADLRLAVPFARRHAHVAQLRPPESAKQGYGSNISCPPGRLSKRFLAP